MIVTMTLKWTDPTREKLRDAMAKQKEVFVSFDDEKVCSFFIESLGEVAINAERVEVTITGTKEIKR